MTHGERLRRTIQRTTPCDILGWLWWDGEGQKYHSKEELARTTRALPHALRIHSLRTSQPVEVGPQKARDAWGSVWQTEVPGILGQVVENPIASYDALAGYKAPIHVLDVGKEEIDRIRVDVRSAPDVLHRIGWMQLYERMRYLRPAQDLYIDIAEDLPELYRLRDVVMEYLHRELDLYLTLGVDVITFSEDWGTQTALQISPAAWRRIFKPAYADLFERVHRAGSMVEFHSCGYIRDIIDDLIDLRVEVIHSQVCCMDLAELARRFKGRVCFEADFDRQRMPVESPGWIRDEVHRIADHLGSTKGGLFIVAEVAGATPLANVEAYIGAIRELARFA